MEEKVKQVMADILLMDVASITAETSRDRVASWDSLAHIDLIAALEEEFGLMFDVDEFDMMTSYNEIVDILSEKL